MSYSYMNFRLKVFSEDGVPKLIAALDKARESTRESGVVEKQGRLPV